MAGSDSKTEKASPKKRKDERKKGNVFQSKDIIAVLSVLIIFLFIKAYFPTIKAELDKVLLTFIEYIPNIRIITPDFLKRITKDIIKSFIMILMPIALMSMVVAIITTGAQTRFLFSMDSLKPKFERINPLKGIMKMFSLRSVVEIVKGSIKIIVIAYMMYNFIAKKMIGFAKSFDMNIVQSVTYLLDAVMQMVMNISMVFIFIAAFDFFYQWWEYERNIKMSKHDVKEEYKQMEGDPKIKGKIKDKQRQMASSRMMQAVPTADVIIKNPTHFAVALKYNVDKDEAPIIVAMGQDELALRIIKTGEENHVYIVENVPLARAIYAAGEIGREIPFEYFSAVAEILALVYSLKQDIKHTENTEDKDIE